ncbi:glycosyltransferase family 2 protein [Desulfogranum mediterraneum]|uniref:glycosyltransferase family 2 protein n=1 Tax=Desulfogranum mediterraneum TaxID=160661 RepID=UPI0004140119|nr:glycosyltransferase family 2 protein [Desulfogranum mediterraneum]
MKPAVIIPVYNHGQQIEAVVRRAARLGLPMVVVDDGSTDGTAAILDHLAGSGALSGLTLLRHPENLGKGAALLSGFGAAVDQGCDWALSLDGDGQHDPADGPRLLEEVADGSRALVLGRREQMESMAHVPWTSRFGRSFSNFWVWAVGGPLVSDSQSGFRLYPLPEVLEFGVRSRRYQFEVEVLVRARQAGLEVREAPVQVVYQPRGERISHFRPWTDFLRNSRLFSRLFFCRLFALLARVVGR